MQFRLRTLMILVAIIAALVAALVPAVLEVRESRVRMKTMHQFCRVAQALQYYNSEHRHLPPPITRATTSNNATVGRPLYGWRRRLSIQLVAFGIEIAPNVAWDDPSEAIFKTAPNFYAYDGWVFDQRSLEAIPTEVNVYAITGPGTAFGDGSTNAPADLDAIEPDTLIAVEVANSGHHWMEPRDFDIREMSREIDPAKGIAISSKLKRGFNVIFADGSVWLISNDVPFKELEKFFTIENARNFDRDKILRKYCLLRQ